MIRGSNFGQKQGLLSLLLQHPLMNVASNHSSPGSLSRVMPSHLVATNSVRYMKAKLDLKILILLM